MPRQRHGQGALTRSHESVRKRGPDPAPEDFGFSRQASSHNAVPCVQFSAARLSSVAGIFSSQQRQQVAEIKRWARAEYSRSISIAHHGGEVSEQRSPYYAEAALC